MFKIKNMMFYMLCKLSFIVYKLAVFLLLAAGGLCLGYHRVGA